MKITPEIIREGILKTIANAQDLCDESQILLDHGKFARAYTLAHLAREEFAKCFILYRVFISLIIGEEIDWKRVRKRYSNHFSKITFDRILSYNIYEIAKPELDKSLIPSDFLKGIDQTNNYKNDSLYVQWSNENDFILPNDKIDKLKAQRNLELAIFRIVMYTKIFIEITSLDEDNIAKIKKVMEQQSIDKEVKRWFEKFSIQSET